MRFRTGLAMLDLTGEISRRLDHVSFPFMILHDPGDCEYSSAGVDAKVLRSKTRKHCATGRGGDERWEVSEQIRCDD